MPALGNRDVVGIVGIAGMGKSTWLQEYLRKHPRVFLFDPFRDIPANYLSDTELLDLHDSGRLRSEKAFTLGTHAPLNLELFGSIAYLTGNCVFVIEECGFAFQKGQIIPDWLVEGIFLGRHNNVSYVFTAQRAISIPIDLRSQMTRFISFRQVEKRDLVYCAEKIGDQGLEQLPPLHCVDWQNGDVSRYAINPPRNRRTPVATTADKAII